MNTVNGWDKNRVLIAGGIIVPEDGTIHDALRRDWVSIEGKPEFAHTLDDFLECVDKERVEEFLEEWFSAGTYRNVYENSLRQAVDNPSKFLADTTWDEMSGYNNSAYVNMAEVFRAWNKQRHALQSNSFFTVGDIVSASCSTLLDDGFWGDVDDPEAGAYCYIGGIYRRLLSSTHFTPTSKKLEKMMWDEAEIAGVYPNDIKIEKEIDGCRDIEDYLDRGNPRRLNLVTAGGSTGNSIHDLIMKSPTIQDSQYAYASAYFELLDRWSVRRHTRATSLEDLHRYKYTGPRLLAYVKLTSSISVLFCLEDQGAEKTLFSYIVGPCTERRMKEINSFITGVSRTAMLSYASSMPISRYSIPDWEGPEAEDSFLTQEETENAIAARTLQGPDFFPEYEIDGLYALYREIVNSDPNWFHLDKTSGLVHRKGLVLSDLARTMAVYCTASLDFPFADYDRGKDSLYSRFANAVELLYEADTTENFVLKPCLAFAAIEAILGRKKREDDTKGVTQILIDNCAAFLEDEAEFHDDAKKHLKKLYDARSSAIHGSYRRDEKNRIKSAGHASRIRFLAACVVSRAWDYLQIRDSTSQSVRYKDLHSLLESDINTSRKFWGGAARSNATYLWRP